MVFHLRDFDFFQKTDLHSLLAKFFLLRIGLTIVEQVAIVDKDHVQVGLGQSCKMLKIT